MALKHEFRLTVTEDARLKMETLKNRLGITMGELLLQSVVLFDIAANAEKRGGRLLLEVPGEETLQLRITNDASDRPSSPTEGT